eukprot:1709020-Prymnesium_polylepis.1
MKDQIPNTTDHRCSRSPCCFAAIGIAAIASFALVLSRRGSCTRSSLTVCRRRRLALLPSASL